jgi:transcriptional regulator with XRE-family HTH domain
MGQTLPGWARTFQRLCNIRICTTTLGDMSRRDVAGRALRTARIERGWSQADLAARAGCDQSTVSRVERGRSGDPDTLRALALALGLPLVRVGLADLAEPDRERLATVRERPQTVDLGAVDALAGVLAARRRAEDAIGPGPMVRPVLADLEAIRELDRHASRAAVRTALGELAAEHAQFLGWLAADLGDTDDACRWYGRAAGWTQRSALVVSTLSMSSQLAAARREVKDALALADAGWAAVNGTPPGVQALLAQQHARAHAISGARHAAEEQLARAVHLAGRAASSPEDEPPWTYFQGPDRLLLQCGVVYTLLGLGRPAVELIGAAMQALPAGMARDRGWAQARLARAHAIAGDVAEAASLGAQAAAIAAEVGSVYTWREVAAVRKALDPWDRDPAVRALESLLR